MKDDRREHLESNLVIWMTQVSTSQAALPYLKPCLDGHDRERAARFQFADDRTRYVLGRALVRKMLGYYLHQAPETIKLGYTNRRQPFLPSGRSLRFSLTHSHDLVAVALTSHAQVGIDIEHVERKLDIEELAERILSKDNFHAFKALPEAEKEATFFRIWTRKEAYLKARGEGISEGLQRISVTFDAEAVAFVADMRDRWAAQKWRIHSVPLPSDYTGCVACDDAAKRVDFQTVRFEGKEVVST